MQKKLRILSFLLVLCLSLTSMTSCYALFRVFGTMGEMGAEIENDPLANVDWEKDPLIYTLTEEEFTEFEAQIELCRTLLLEGTQISKIEEEMNKLEERYYYFATQSQIAYILYCFNTSDEALSERHLFASEVSSDAYTLYNEMCRALDASDSPYKETFFEGWTETELSEMRLYTEEVADLRAENDEILVAFREFDDDQLMSDTPELYMQLVANNNAIAEIFGYDNYYDYANERIYYRDYGTEERDVLRFNTRRMKNLLIKAYDRFSNGAQGLSSGTYNLLVRVLESDYNTTYLDAYLNSLPEQTREEMRTVLTTGGSVFVDDARGYAGAFTTTLYDQGRPFCYFGPGYQSLFTVVHEMGHYYSGIYNNVNSYDLAELQSQGNEWLLISRASEFIDTAVAPVMTDYLIYNQLATAIIGSMIDEFEERVYKNADTLTAEDLDGIMDTVCGLYGGKSFISEYMTDISYYWRVVCMESPVYYLSYSTSGLTSLGLFFSAKEDYNAAVNTYVTIATGLGANAGFNESIQTAGLLSPFENELYNKLLAYYK